MFISYAFSKSRIRLRPRDNGTAHGAPLTCNGGMHAGGEALNRCVTGQSTPLPSTESIERISRSKPTRYDVLMVMFLTSGAAPFFFGRDTLRMPLSKAAFTLLVSTPRGNGKDLRNAPW